MESYFGNIVRKVRKVEFIFLIILSMCLYSELASASCSLSSTQLAFGSYDVLNNTDNASSAQITVDCTPNASGTISINGGNNGNVSQRKMTNSSEYLNYNVYTNAQASNIWGDGITGIVSNFNTATSNPSVFYAYGIIPARQDVSSGNYSDALLVTVEF